jgi:hypothetical protein
MVAICEPRACPNPVSTADVAALARAEQTLGRAQELIDETSA